MKLYAAIRYAAFAALSLCVACDNPFTDDGESTPEEDAVAIATYTQTVNQSSQDTTVAPVVNVDGNNNQVTIIYGDDNAPTSDNIRNIPEEPVEDPAP